MAVVYQIFYIVLFTTVIGSVFTLSVLFLDRLFRIAMPFWAGILGMALYVVPVPAPGLVLVSPEESVWVEGYKVMCAVWAWGIIFFILCGLVRMWFAHRAAAGYPLCDQENIHVIGAQCAVMAGLKKVPGIYFGELEDPACVVGVMRPKIILNKKVIVRLSETQLTAVLGHEMIHIKRRHMVLGRIYDVICLLNWPNPFVWLAKKEFDVLCENDCDKNALTMLKGHSPREYALTMLRLLELSTAGVSVSGSSLSASGFLLTKRRMALVMNRRGRVYEIFSTAAILLVIIGVIFFSLQISRGHFYPYPAYSRGIEYSRAAE